eukprot:CAMPEP_0177781210 /NCGR_PEP_ID=MMETSP0491_2-20121128/17708_1 /TAXON_ID=63592 /ORGANISM="Tetraselmis chuii, Strain PLY429" /LENGTH=314 /DNA_ID=CAMNT_0019301219 /DNA_START=113 /DNA_END=1057 /DNA_ORIENTATION=+
MRALHVIRNPSVGVVRAVRVARESKAGGRSGRAAVRPAFDWVAGGRSTLPKLASSRDESGGSNATESLYGGLDPTLEQSVPRDQRPANELKAIKEASLYKWALCSTPGYALRLFFLYAATFGLISGPISYQTFDPMEQPFVFFLSGSTGSLLVVSVAVIRMYLGWSYVGNRLLSASVEYEETGWYDGQVFVKPQEILARDRLLGTYEAKPVLSKLKRTLIACALSLISCAGALTVCISNGTDADGVYGRGAAVPRAVTADGIIYSGKVTSVNQLRYDDDAAAAEAAASGDRPAYCGDRYFTSLAGGEKVCAKFK